MTNTRITDPEVLERRYPVRLREFSVRRGSGGAGRHRGGDGVIRRLEFLRRLEVYCSLAAPRPLSALRPRRRPARRLGRNVLPRADGRPRNSPAACRFTAQAGDVLVIETPGGGGYGRKEDAPSPNDEQPRQ